eukprot:NODE_736_length_4341_cov_0.251297.p6 type:complete len:106 gc:universal NODE_736_length_4341_cov_0.251297:935-1252(+)
MINLKWKDVAMKSDENGQFISIRLHWHKKAQLQKEVQVYNIPSETNYPALDIVKFYQDYMQQIRQLNSNVQDHANFIPAFKITNNGQPVVDWYSTATQIIHPKYS